MCFATEQQCSEAMSSKGLVDLKSCSAFPCLNVPFCPWCPGMDTWDLEEGKAKSALFLSFRCLHRASLVLCTFHMTFTLVTSLKKPIIKPTSLCCLPNQHEYPRLFVLRTLSRTAIFWSGNWPWCNSHCVLHHPRDMGPPPFESTRNLRAILAFLNSQLENYLEPPSGTINRDSCLYKPLSLCNLTDTLFL